MKHDDTDLVFNVNCDNYYKYLVSEYLYYLNY